MVWWPGPDDQAVPLISKSRLDVLVFQPEQVLVNDQLLEVGVNELLPLLAVALDTMG